MDPHFYITESSTVLHHQPSHQLLLLKLLDPQVLILIKYSKRRKKIPVKSRFNLILILRKIKVQKIQQMRTLGIFKQLADFLTCINKLLFINEISFGQGWCTLCMIKCWSKVYAMRIFKAGQCSEGEERRKDWHLHRCVVMVSC